VVDVGIGPVGDGLVVQILVLDDVGGNVDVPEGVREHDNLLVLGQRADLGVCLQEGRTVRVAYEPFRPRLQVLQEDALGHYQHEQSHD